MRTAVLSWLMLPVYIWQGVGIRRSIERMLPPAGPFHGLAGLASGEAPIRLLVLGD